METYLNTCRFCKALECLNNKEQVAELKDGTLSIGGQQPTDIQIEELAREVQILSQMNLWKLLTETVRSQAIDLGIRQAKDFDQLMFAKAMLHVIGVQERLVNLVTKEYNVTVEAKRMAERAASKSAVKE